MARAHAHSSTVICKRLSVAAGFQVWNGMMVLLGLHLDGMRPTLRGTSAFTAHAAVATLEMHAAAMLSNPE